MISIVTHARNDNYGGLDWNGQSYLDKIYESFSKNLEAIEKLNVPYEYIIVEWCPMNEYLIYIPRFKELFEKYKNLKTVVVDKSVAIAETLDPKSYLEYFAKNVGVRHAIYENIIMTNSDIIIYPKTLKTLVNLIKEGLDDKIIYRLIWRFHGAGPHPQEQTGRIQNNAETRLLAGSFPGDIHMTTKLGFHKYGNAYDETNANHKTLAHTGMDSEMILNWIENGGTQVWLNESYWHINHHHPNKLDSGYSAKPYENRHNWGFIDYDITKINDQLTLIKDN